MSAERSEEPVQSLLKRLNDAAARCGSNTDRRSVGTPGAESGTETHPVRRLDTNTNNSDRVDAVATHGKVDIHNEVAQAAEARPPDKTELSNLIENAANPGLNLGSRLGKLDERTTHLTVQFRDLKQLLDDHAKELRELNDAFKFARRAGGTVIAAIAILATLVEASPIFRFARDSLSGRPSVAAALPPTPLDSTDHQKAEPAVAADGQRAVSRASNQTDSAQKR
jgi:hypothetical protein